MAKPQKHPETITIYGDEIASLIASAELWLTRLEQLERRYYGLEISPGGAALWHLPQVSVVNRLLREQARMDITSGRIDERRAPRR
jgi:hypothetical protein